MHQQLRSQEEAKWKESKLICMTLKGKVKGFAVFLRSMVVNYSPGASLKDFVQSIQNGRTFRYSFNVVRSSIGLKCYSYIIEDTVRGGIK